MKYQTKFPFRNSIPCEPVNPSIEDGWATRVIDDADCTVEMSESDRKYISKAKYWYHATPKENIYGIWRYGLLYRRKGHHWNLKKYPNQLFFSSDQKGAMFYMQQIVPKWKKGVVLLRVSAKLINEMTKGEIEKYIDRDRNVNQPANSFDIAFRQSISPDNIEILTYKNRWTALKSLVRSDILKIKSRSSFAPYL